MVEITGAVEMKIALYLLQTPHFLQSSTAIGLLGGFGIFIFILKSQAGKIT